MSNFLHTKLAVSNIKNNKKIIFPYILSTSFMVMIFYIISSLQSNDNITSASVRQMLSYGIFIIAIFIMVFLFYTYSFIIKNRIKQLGLYAVLGMTRNNIARIVFLEVIITYVITMLSGISFGIIFDKFSYLVITNIMEAEVSLGFYISFSVIVSTILFFLVVHILIILVTLIKIYRLNIIKIIKEEKTVEKEPKTKWLLTLIGAVSIGYGYYVALTIKTPLEAIYNFFYAVVAVIIGTYLLFIAISIFVLKILKNNKNYYYKTKNFISISSMLYRMKRNAVGLASICILSTMTLVTLGSTVSLYTATEDFIRKNIPSDIVIQGYNINDEKEELVKGIKEKVLKENKTTASEEMLYTFAYGVGLKEEEGIKIIRGDSSHAKDFDKVASLIVLSLDEYNKNNNTKETLEDGEILLSDERNDIKRDTFIINSKKYKIKKEIEIVGNIGNTNQNLTDTYFIVVKNKEELDKIADVMAEELYKGEGDNYNIKQMYYTFNISNNSKENVDKIEKAFIETLKDSKEYEKFGNFLTVLSKTNDGKEIKSFYGSLLFIGIFISVVFIISQVVIMYYKQITEGYDDKNKFEIMQKVGLESREIKRSIKSQILIVFFSPLLVALVHLLVAYPFIEKVLKLFQLSKPSVFLYSMIATAVVFSLFYYIVYEITSKVYYKIIK